MSKLFLGGISTATTTEGIREYFSQFGEVTDAVAMVKPDGSPRGFGFVTYAEAFVAEDVMASEHELDGARVDIKSADGKKQFKSSAPAAHPYAGAGAYGGPARVPSYNAAPPPRMAYQAPPPRQMASLNQAPAGGGGKGGRDERFKLFLGGISPLTTTEAIVDLFSAYGETIDAVAMKRPDGTPRGFGFVTFAEEEPFQAVLEAHSIAPIELDGRALDIKSAAPPGQAPAPRGQPAQPQVPRTPGPRTDKIFVGGLAPELTEGELVDYFSQYGAIIDHVIMTDKATGKPKGFGFITFDNMDSVEFVMADKEAHQLCGKWVECKKADGQKGGAGGAKGCGGFGGGKGFVGAYHQAPPAYAPRPTYGYGPATTPAKGKGYAPAYSVNPGPTQYGGKGAGCFGGKGARANPYLY